MPAIPACPEPTDNTDGPIIDTGIPGVAAWFSQGHVIIDTTRELVMTPREALAFSATIGDLARLADATHRYRLR